MNIKKKFTKHYSYGMIFASVVFGSTDAMGVILITFINNKEFSINPTAILSLLPFEILQSILFFIIGWPIAYLPCIALVCLFKRKYPDRVLVYVFCGFAYGILFLPICAILPFLLIPPPDGPDYLARCVKYALPMMIAGAAGGYFFFYNARKWDDNVEEMSNQFS